MLKWARPLVLQGRGPWCHCAYSAPPSFSGWPAYQAWWSLPPQLVSMGPLLCSVSLVQISFTDQQFPPSSPQLQSLSALSDIHTAARVMDLKHPLLCHTHAWELSKGPPENGRAPVPPLSTAPAFACWSHIVCLALRTPNLSLSVSHVLQKTHHSVPPRPSTPSGNIYKASKYVHGDAMSVSWHLLSVSRLNPLIFSTSPQMTNF